MKDFVLLSVAFLGVIVAAKLVLAGPLNVASNKELDQPVKTVSKRSLDGVFDAISNGFEGLMSSFKKVGNSVLEAFNGIFSNDNKNAISDGFEKFGKGLRDASNGMFGENGEKVTNGFKKVGDKIKGVFNGDSSKDTPTGEVPAQETT